ncbi:FHA domain-containing protein [Pontiella sulfatireligans]|uniref:FHA domain-containing protein n=1 Tax=Pontiella sulfatireligans TaxID=2750658 RepID=A0A6C2UNH8_9BACT|nr:FHA domain-containing protein [Pontiella sulfatireligans]VGO21493.1 hypothetical protein SCARR_03567 [Pontiella sulfatireligans]
MSHLIIEQGKGVGAEVSVPSAGMKFGRSPANDLVLEDPAAMLFHGRFFFKSDGSLWVTDFGAGEKTVVGGIPIDEYQLKSGDLVEVGETAFRIINTTQEDAVAPPPAPPAPVPVPEPPPPPAPAAALGGEEIDLGFKGGRKTRSKPQAAVEATPQQAKGSLMHRLMQVIVILLVLGVLVFIVPQLLEMVEDTPEVVVKKETMALSYERVQADTRNIFRYYLELDEKGNLSMAIDDLKNNRHIQKQKKVEETVMLHLAVSIDDAGFFEVDSDYAGTSQGQYDLYDIAVQRNRRFQQIKVLNREPPAEIKRTVSVIEDFALSELGISHTFFKDNAKLLELAEEALNLGGARYAERDVRYGNLAEAIRNYSEAMLYLETFEPKPAIYRKASEGLLRANTERNDRYKEHMFSAEQSIRLQEWDAASKQLRILSELIPERNDPRHDTISSKLLNVEQHLR